MTDPITKPAAPAPPRHRTALRWVAVVAWAAVIFAMSSLHGSQVPGRFGEEAHVAEYAVLGALLVFALLATLEVAPAARIALVACWVYAASDEWHQAFVPGRVCDPIDWTRDAVGAGIGIALALLFLGWLARKRARTNAL
jgi:VanZ family protein